LCGLVSDKRFVRPQTEIGRETERNGRRERQIERKRWARDDFERRQCHSERQLLAVGEREKGNGTERERERERLL